MMRSDKAIITCAITGSIHTPSMSPYLPITPEQIAEEAIAAARAGAAMIHLHARDPVTGRPDQSPELFKQFLPAIKAATDAIKSPGVEIRLGEALFGGYQGFHSFQHVRANGAGYARTRFTGYAIRI